MEKQVSVLADILANSMEHFEDVFAFTENLKANTIQVRNEADIWVQYWQIEPLERDSASFNWEGWVIENEFLGEPKKTREQLLYENAQTFDKDDWYGKDGQIYQMRSGKTILQIPYFDEENEEQVRIQHLVMNAPILLETLKETIKTLRLLKDHLSDEGQNRLIAQARVVYDVDPDFNF